MATIPAPRAHATSGSLAARLKENPTYQAFWLLRIGFTVAPCVRSGLPSAADWLLIGQPFGLREDRRAAVVYRRGDINTSMTCPNWSIQD